MKNWRWRASIFSWLHLTRNESALAASRRVTLDFRANPIPGKWRALHIIRLCGVLRVDCYTVVWLFFFARVLCPRPEICLLGPSRWDVPRPQHLVNRSAQRRKVVLPLANRAVRNLQQWLIGTYQAVSRDQLQVYLDELVFRHNRRRQPMAAFQTLLGLGTGHKSTAYQRIRRHRPFQLLHSATNPTIRRSSLRPIPT